MLQILIHGITNKTDALAAAKLGADGLGFILDEGDERYIEYTLARDIFFQLPPMTTTVLQTDNFSPEQLGDLVKKLRLNSLLVPVSEYSRAFEHLGCHIVITGAGENIYEFASNQPEKRTLLARDLLLSILMQMDEEERDAWQKINQDHFLFVRCDVTPDELPLALERFQPAGLFFEGGTESQTGLQDYPRIKSYVEAIHQRTERV